MFIKRSLLATLVLLCMAGSSMAGSLEDLIHDLQPVDGYVVLPLQDEYLIDLDATKGLVVGDLFNVVQPGEKITHPVTGKVIGTLDGSKGILQVTQIKTGFSHTKLLTGKGPVNKADAIRRYDGLTTAFLDYTDKAESLFSSLKAALPALDWQGYSAVQVPGPLPAKMAVKDSIDLFLVVNKDGITVRDTAFKVVRAYPLPTEVAIAAPVASQTGATPTPYKLDATPSSSSPSGIQYEAAFPGFKSLGNPGFAVVMADFVTIGSRTLLAATDGKSIKLFEVGNSLTFLTEVTPSDLAQVLTLHWWQPSADQICLAVAGWRDSKLSSTIYRFSTDRLAPMVEYLPYMFGTFDRNGDGVRELLLAQKFDRERVWGTYIKEGRLTGDKFSMENLSFKLPYSFTVASSTMADITSNGQPETIFVRNGLLYIYSGTKQLYKSSKMMGGTLSRFIYEEDPNARETRTHYAAFEVPPIAADLDGDGQLELVTVASDSGLLSTPGLTPGVRKSWLAVLKKKDNMFVKGSLGEEMDMPLQGLTVANNQVLFVATEPGSVFGKDGGSQLLVFPLMQ